MYQSRTAGIGNGTYGPPTTPPGIAISTDLFNARGYIDPLGKSDAAGVPLRIWSSIGISGLIIDA